MICTPFLFNSFFCSRFSDQSWWKPSINGTRTNECLQKENAITAKEVFFSLLPSLSLVIISLWLSKVERTQFQMKKTPVRLQMNAFSHVRKSNDAFDILMGLLFIEFKQQTNRKKLHPLYSCNNIHTFSPPPKIESMQVSRLLKWFPRTTSSCKAEWRRKRER